jgi:hypothetical protein
MTHAYLKRPKEERRKLAEKVFCATSRLAKLRAILWRERQKTPN